MAALGHVAIGLAIGRIAAQSHPPHRRIAIYLAAAWLAASPDIDTYLGLMGINHHGPTHSVGFVIIAVVAAVLLSRAGDWAVRPVAVMTAAAVGGHVVVDMLGAGEAMPLLWPVSTVTFEPYGLLTAPDWTTDFRFEMIWSAPIVVYGLWPALGVFARLVRRGARAIR